MSSSNALDPQSPFARAIYDLGIVSTIILGLIFVIVSGGIVYAILRFRARAMQQTSIMATSLPVAAIRDQS